MPRRRLAVVTAAVSIVAGLALAGCDDDMSSQNKNKTWHAAEPPPNGLQWPLTPPRGMVSRDAPEPPPALSLALLRRGQQRFDIDCAPCHAATGDGRGMIVERGFPQPPALDEPRIVAAPTKHYVDVITDGYGIMYSFAERVGLHDRWAIAAYIRALQRARSATVADIPADQAKALQ
ncbi:MAG TPA: cytochrome c [Stellaceae bacterium]|nr:cytochrome c [Stellaceae bacterium]